MDIDIGGTFGKSVCVCMCVSVDDGIFIVHTMGDVAIVVETYLFDDHKRSRNMLFLL